MRILVTPIIPFIRMNRKHFFVELRKYLSDMRRPGRQLVPLLRLEGRADGGAAQRLVEFRQNQLH